MTLLSHFFTPDTDPAVARAQAQDWWEVLSPFSEAAISEACREWLRAGPPRRPTPGEIRTLIGRDMAARTRGRLEPVPALPPPDAGVDMDRRAADAAMAKRVLDSVGFTPQRFAYVQAHPMATSVEDVDEDGKAKRVPHWSELPGTTMHRMASAERERRLLDGSYGPEAQRIAEERLAAREARA